MRGAVGRRGVERGVIDVKIRSLWLKLERFNRKVGSLCVEKF